MLSRRLSDITTKADSPFVMAAAARGRIVRAKDAAMLNALPKEGAVERTLDLLLTEAARVARFGFTPTEFDRQKLDTLRTYERYYAERDKHESAGLADELVRHFPQNETLPGPALELALHQRFLPEITLDEVNGRQARGRRRSPRHHGDAVEKPGVAPVEEAALAAVVQGVGAKPITATSIPWPA